VIRERGNQRKQTRYAQKRERKYQGGGNDLQTLRKKIVQKCEGTERENDFKESWEDCRFELNLPRLLSDIALTRNIGRGLLDRRPESR